VAGVGRQPAYTGARQQLQRLGISPNAAFSGVELDSQLHAVIHTDAVGAALNDMLASKSTASDAQASLEALGEFLYDAGTSVPTDLVARREWVNYVVVPKIQSLVGPG
jgi:hypothetical protein